MHSEANQQSLLTFRVGPVLCCAPSLPVNTIITPPKLTHPPGSDTSQPGIFKHGAHIVKVIDLRQKFGVDLPEQSQPGNLIITRIENESFAFWVDQILDVFDFPTKGWGNLPAAIPRGIFSRTLLLNKKIHLYSEFSQLASIHDLGYLKHYIQQLKQQVTENEKTILSPTVTTTRQQENKTTSIKKDSARHASSSQEVKKTAIDIEKQKPAAIVKTTPSIKIKTPPVTEPIPATLTTKKQVNTFNAKPVATKASDKTKTTTTPLQKKITPAVKPAAIEKVKQQHIKNQFTLPSQTEHKTKAPPATNSGITSAEPLSTKKDKSNFAVIFFFIFLLGSLSIGAYYFLSPNDNKKSYRYKKEEKINVTEGNNSFKEEQETTISPAFETINPAQDNTVDSEDIINNTTEETVTTVAENETNNNMLYQADITQQNNEITITIHEPASTTPPQAKEPVIESKIKAEEVSETAAVETLKKDELNQTLAPEKIVKEVIHIVIKGDTLWAIAKKYVNNPFLYPELARLSKIKNPHRIYPGNRVRIRFIKK